MKPRVSVLFALALLGACQRGQDRAVERVVEGIIASKGRESAVDIDREHGSIRVELGRAITPKGWPEAVPIYPHADGAKIERSEGEWRHLTVASEDSIAELRRYYREALAKAGWEWQDGGRAQDPWSARRGAEALRMRFADRGGGRGSRADIEYSGSS